MTQDADGARADAFVFDGFDHFHLHKFGYYVSGHIAIEDEVRQGPNIVSVFPAEEVAELAENPSVCRVAELRAWVSVLIQDPPRLRIDIEADGLGVDGFCEPFKGGRERESIYLRIAVGMRGTAHPAVPGLPQEQLTDLVEYVLSL